MANETAAQHLWRCNHKGNHRPEDCPNRKPDSTTAQTLGAYRRELEAEEISPDVISTLVIEAARLMVRDDGLTVRAERPGVTK